MKNLIFTIALAIGIYTNAWAQAKKASPLSINDPLPVATKLGSVLDSYGNISSSYDSKTFFKDFKGKLIILDFWQTYCHSCVEHFEYISELQEKYKGKVQIFLVNPLEDEQRIQNWIVKQNAKRDKNNPIVPPNLPILGNAMHLLKLFPGRAATGYHVWINAEGRMILRGISENTHQNKIEEALAGKTITFLEDNALKYDKEKPFFITGVSAPKTNQPVLSAFARYDDKNADIYSTGTFPDAIVDSISGTKRITLLNFSAEKLYRLSVTDSTYNLINAQFLNGDPVVIDVRDITKVSLDEHKTGVRNTDQSYTDAAYCYEQLNPEKDSIRQIREYMLNSLNANFGLLLGIKGELTKRKLDVYKLNVIDSTKMVKSNSEKLITNLGGTLGRRFTSFEGGTVEEIFKEYFRVNYFPFSKEAYIVAGNLSKARISITLPSSTSELTISDLNQVLSKSGLELVKTSQISTVFLIRDLQ